jgi:hypothetical protein
MHRQLVVSGENTVRHDTSCTPALSIKLLPGRRSPYMRIALLRENPEPSLNWNIMRKIERALIFHVTHLVIHVIAPFIIQSLLL